MVSTFLVLRFIWFRHLVRKGFRRITGDISFSPINLAACSENIIRVTGWSLTSVSNAHSDLRRNAFEMFSRDVVVAFTISHLTGAPYLRHWKEVQSPTLNQSTKRSDNRRDTSSATQGYIWCIRTVRSILTDIQQVVFVHSFQPRWKACRRCHRYW